MSIEVKNITKLYGKQKALDDVSFQVNTGEVIGFLGPNGAGKSTMMKIITCFIPQTSGKVTVNGFDTVERSLDVRKVLGYLPEHNPLYVDMYIKEYLEFVGGLHEGWKGDKLRKRVKEMIAMTGLEVEQHKKIGALSKGYRQRVGIAQAMIHDPQVLILDEPTTGLDPNQLAEIRELIRQIGKQKTVMLSTHIMQEVEAVCNRVIIINNGKVVANESTTQIQQGPGNKVVITVEFDKAASRNLLRSLPDVEDAHEIEKNIWKVIAPEGKDIRAAIFQLAVKNNLTVLSLTKEEQKLEDVFKQLTRKK